MIRRIEQVRFTEVAPKKKRVAAYARVSSGKDAMLHSLSAQVSYYSEYIQRHGWEYAGVYVDEAITGTKDKRENFQKLLEECRAGDVQMVITKSISRFARNTVTLLQTVRELKDLGVDVYFEEQNIHTMSADGELMLTILASYAQEESLSASENQKWRIQKCFQNGDMVNTYRIFGYRYINGTLVVEPTEAEYVREIFQRAIRGDTFGSISKWLNENGIRCSSGGEWRATRIRGVLSNEKYTGNLLLQKSFRNNHLEKEKCPNRGELPQYYAEGTHEAIVDMDIYEKAQEVLVRLDEEAAKRTPPKRSAFTGMIKCSCCGKNYRRGTGAVRSFWNCSTYLSKGKSFCQAKQIPEETLFSITAEALGVSTVDADTIHSRLTLIQAEKDNTLVFCFKDGTQAVKQWQDRSRAESWTEEKKENARKQRLARTIEN